VIGVPPRQSTQKKCPLVLPKYVESRRHSFPPAMPTRLSYVSAGWPNELTASRVPTRLSGPPVVAVRSSNRQPLHHPKLLPLREKTIWRFTFFGRCGRGSGMKQHIEPDGFGKEITT